MALRAPGSQSQMSHFVYILWSEKLKKYYIGSTQDVENRFREHNKGESKFTSKGIPWNLIWKVEIENKGVAIRLEQKIKKRGAKRYLEDNSGGSSAR